MTNLADIHTELHELNKNLKKLIEIQEMTLFFLLKREGLGLTLKSLQSLFLESVLE